MEKELANDLFRAFPTSELMSPNARVSDGNNMGIRLGNLYPHLFDFPIPIHTSS